MVGQAWATRSITGWRLRPCRLTVKSEINRSLCTLLLLFVRAMGENGRDSMPNSTRTFEPPFTDVPGALAEIRAGRMVVVVDDEDRENEGDLTLAAEHVTPEAINFMPAMAAA